MQKTVLLAAPHRFGFTKMFVQNLQFHGYNVIDIGYSTDDFTYKSLKDRLVNTIRKTLLHDRQYKKQLLFNQHRSEVQQRLNALSGKADYALIIRSDLYSKELINLVKHNAKKMIGYQWDGIDRYPEILDHISLYDAFYVFDENDVAKYSNYGVKPITNFYFDFDHVHEEEDLSKSFFFIGTHQPDRVAQINKVAKELISIGYQPNVIIYSEKSINQQVYEFPVKLISHMMNYQEALDQVKNNGILLDFKNNVHNGLSFRIFESIRYQKKLITDNESVAKYAFYNPDNIYILDRSENSIAEFITTDYQPVAQDILDKFGFKEWIENLLN